VGHDFRVVALLQTICVHAPVLGMPVEVCVEPPDDRLFGQKERDTHGQQLPTLGQHVGGRVHLGLCAEVEQRARGGGRRRVTQVPRVLPTQQQVLQWNTSITFILPKGNTDYIHTATGSTVENQLHLYITRRQY